MAQSGKPKMVIEFDQYGNTKIDAQCFVGAQCEIETAKIVQALGGEKQSDDRKPEFYQTPNAAQTQAQRF